MKRLATILVGLMLTSCSMGYYANNGMGLSTIANISVQPAWGPAGYDCAHYYYFPDYNFYYDVNRALFYYHQNKRWISAKHLPYGLGYPRDLYRLYKVVLNNVRNPWNYNRRHISEYKHFRGVQLSPYCVPTIVRRTTTVTAYPTTTIARNPDMELLRMAVSHLRCSRETTMVARAIRYVAHVITTHRATM